MRIKEISININIKINQLTIFPKITYILNKPRRIFKTHNKESINHSKNMINIM